MTRPLRMIIVGMGLQGRKRLSVARDEVVATVSPIDADYPSVEQVPLDAFEAALVCTPDETKVGLLTYLLSHGKHVLVEKPLLASERELAALQQLARAGQAACYTAYNHRFEPNLVRLKEALDAHAIGRVYLGRLSYGNGTALDVKRSSWRDQGMGVLADLGSHLLDLVLWFFGQPEERFELWSLNRFENNAPDHALVGSTGTPRLALETSMVSWRNTFTVDVYGERGSVHVDGLCKWGPSAFILRTRVLPSGKPLEERQVLERQDPTWELEYAHFKQLCAAGETTLEKDLWINRVLHEVWRQVAEAVPA